MAKPSYQSRCFELFEKHPRTSIKALSSRFGISRSVLYRYKRQWNEQQSQSRPIVEQPSSFSIATFFAGFLLGVAATAIAFGV